MGKKLILFAAIAIFLLGALTSFLVTRSLYYSGKIFNEKEVPNPVFESAKHGRYDEAVQEALAQIHDESKDYYHYEEVVTVYLMRAYKDEPRRVQWVEQAAQYTDKFASLGASDPANLFAAAYDYERAGDLSKNGCPYYEKAAKLSEKLDSFLKDESIMVKDWKFPTKYLRPSNDALHRRLAEKLDSWCSKTTN